MLTMATSTFDPVDGLNYARMNGNLAYDAYGTSYNIVGVYQIGSGSVAGLSCTLQLVDPSVPTWTNLAITNLLPSSEGTTYWPVIANVFVNGPRYFRIKCNWPNVGFRAVISKASGLTNSGYAGK